MTFWVKRNQSGRFGFSVWQKGQTGNPLGRGLRDSDRKVRRLAQQHTERAVATLVKYLDSDNPSAAIAAANALLDRGYGKPRQTVDKTVTRKLVADERAASIREILASGESSSEGRSVQ